MTTHSEHTVQVQEVQELIKSIEDFLSDKEDYETVLHHSGTVIQVFYKDFDPIAYHGYELVLFKRAFQQLGSDIEFKITESEGNKYFTINTSAIYNLESTIASFNKRLQTSPEVLNSDEICSVYLGNSLIDSQMEYSILTAKFDGTWMRYDITKSELLYALINKMQLTLSAGAGGAGGAFVFEDMINMHREYFSVLEKLEKDLN